MKFTERTVNMRNVP